MSYNRPPNVVIAGTGLKQNPPPSTTAPPGIVPVTLETDIASTSNLGVIQVGAGLSITPSGVLSANGGGSSLINVTLVNADYTAVTSDYYIGATAKNITITFPLGIAGKVFIVKNQTTGSITVTGQPGQTLDSSTSKNLGSESSLIAVFDGTRWNIV